MGRPRKNEAPAGEREGGDEWKSWLSLKQPYADEIRGLADSLGVPYQAMLKILLDEALRARRERKGA